MFKKIRPVLLGLALVLAASAAPRSAEAINCTFSACPVSNPCPGTIIQDLYCCPPGKTLACFYALRDNGDGTGCISNVTGICL